MDSEFDAVGSVFYEESKQLRKTKDKRFLKLVLEYSVKMLNQFSFYNAMLHDRLYLFYNDFNENNN